jgi:ABC-type uncharacterized transport system substrate-binding protein
MELGVVARGQGGDPAKAGLVDDLDLPGGNVTGLYGFNAGLEVKRLELLPTAGTIGLLLNLGNSNVASQTANFEDAVQAALRLYRLTIRILRAQARCF